MVDREKVIDALKRCSYDPDPGQPRKEIFSCSDCPYYRGCYHGCTYDLMRDALALLREQEARVMTLEEVINAKDKTDVWLDEPDCVVVAATISNWVEPKNYAVTFFFGIEHTASEEINYMNNNYNKTWRCWTSRPTEEQMRDTPWEEENETM